MPKATLSRVAADFCQLARRFQEYATRAVKPSHLLVDVEQSAVRAGRLLQEATDAGAFRTEKWWREGMLDGWSFLPRSLLMTGTATVFVCFRSRNVFLTDPN